MGLHQFALREVLEVAIPMLDCLLGEFCHTPSNQVAEHIGKHVCINNSIDISYARSTCFTILYRLRAKLTICIFPSAFFALLTSLFLPPYLPVQMFLIVSHLIALFLLGES